MRPHRAHPLPKRCLSEQRRRAELLGQALSTCLDRARRVAAANPPGEASSLVLNLCILLPANSWLPRAEGHKTKELSPPGLSASTRASSCGQDALGPVVFRNILSLDLQLQGGRQSTSSGCPNPCPVLGTSLPGGCRVFYRAEAWKSKFGGERLGWKLLAPAPRLPLGWIKPHFRQLLSAPSPPCN